MKRILITTSLLIGLTGLNCALAAQENGFGFSNTVSDANYKNSNIMELVFNNCPKNIFLNAKNGKLKSLPSNFPTLAEGKLQYTLSPQFTKTCKVVYSNKQTACVITVSHDNNNRTLIEVRTQQGGGKQASSYFCSMKSAFTGSDINVITLSNSQSS